MGPHKRGAGSPGSACLPGARGGGGQDPPAGKPPSRSCSFCDHRDRPGGCGGLGRRCPVAPGKSLAAPAMRLPCIPSLGPGSCLGKRPPVISLPVALDTSGRAGFQTRQTSALYWCCDMIHTLSPLLSADSACVKCSRGKNVRSVSVYQEGLGTSKAGELAGEVGQQEEGGVAVILTAWIFAPGVKGSHERD